MTDTVRPATTSFENTQGHNVYTCDRHATNANAKKVGGPYRTWETGAVFHSGRRVKWCEVCTYTPTPFYY